ncbi:MAG TPA: glycosyltransferase family 4 protein [Puia sp.]|nr:glycosyltransferase family 4 protein [Puia sp.]
MRFVFVNYNYSPDMHSPSEWFERIKIYAGTLTCLSKEHYVARVERIDYTGSCIHNGIHHYFTGYSKRNLWFPRRFNRFAKRLKPDIAVVPGLHYPLQVIQLRWLLGREVKIIVQHHAEKPFTGIKKYVQRLADNCIDAYLFSSRSMGLDWVSRGNLKSPEKIHEVMEVSSVFHPIAPQTARLETGVTGNPIFLWVGRLNENKNPLMVIRAFLSFAASHPDARLYMIYHTTEMLDEINPLLDEVAGGRRQVNLVGAQSHAFMINWYNSADFIISGSWYEGSSTAICEAMSCGCIPIVTNIFSFGMMTGNGRCGLVYEPGDGVGLQSALERAIRMDLSEERRKVLEQFRSTLSFEAIAGKIQKIAESL